MGNPELNPITLPVALVSLGVLVVGSALAVGTVHYEVLIWVAGFAVVSTSVVLVLARSQVRALPPPALVLLALAAWSALQALPMPIAVLSKIAPHNADVWTRALHPFGDPALRFGSISLDPGASLVEALKWFVYAMVLTLASLVSSWRSRAVGPAIAFASAVCVALVALGHGLVGATSLFGVYTPELAVPRWGMPPILNPNNLSGYLNLGAFAGLGLLLAHRGDDPLRPLVRRGLIGAGLALVVAVSVLAASRAGALGLALGVMLFAALVWLSGSERRERAALRGEKLSGRRASVPAVLALGGGILLAIVGASDTTWAELWEANAEKLRIASWSRPLIKDFPRFGVGRGAFESVFPAYRPASGHVLYAYPENFLVQWTTEWGVPVAAAACLALVWIYRPSRERHQANSVRIGAWVGIGVLLLQNLVDLALEIPAVAILVAAVLGALYTERPVTDAIPPPDRESNSTERRRRKRSLWRRVRRRALALATFAAGALVFGLATVYGHNSLSDERSELRAAYQALRFDDVEAITAFQKRLRETILRHPAEPYFPLLGAIAAHRTKGGNPLPWISAALERDPENGRAHLLLADILAAKGAVLQALMELRIAVEDEPALVYTAGLAAVRFTKDTDALERAAPGGSSGALMLVTIAGAIQGNEKRDVRMMLFNKALGRDPASVEALSARATELLGAITSNLPPCGASERKECLDRVRQDGDAIRRIAPMSCQPLILQARVFELEEQIDAGEDILAAGCTSCREAESCAADRVRLAAKKKASDRLTGAVRAYLAVACSREVPCIHPQTFVGDILAGRADWTLAAEHYRLAAMAADTSDAWLKAANAASHAGDAIAASQALGRAQRRGGHDPTLEKQVDKQRQDLLHQGLVPADR
jgi:tetratricopeptide (TPR) repeat protein